MFQQHLCLCECVLLQVLVSQCVATLFLYKMTISSDVIHSTLSTNNNNSSISTNNTTAIDNNISPSDSPTQPMHAADMTSIEESVTATCPPTTSSQSPATSPATTSVTDDNDEYSHATPPPPPPPPTSAHDVSKTLIDETKKTNNSLDETETEEEDGDDDDVIDKKCASKRDSDVQSNVETKKKTEDSDNEHDEEEEEVEVKEDETEEEEVEGKCNRASSEERAQPPAVSSMTTKSMGHDEISSEDVAEMARLRAAKFIQERTKMACLLPSAAEAESVKQSNSISASHHAQSNAGGQGSGTSSRKRKLTVKDILVSQRTRESKQQRMSINDNNNISPTTVNNNLGALGQLMPGLGAMAGGMLDPTAHLSEANPLAALLAAAAAAAATSTSNPNVSSNGATANLAQAFMPDSQSAYISSLASSLSQSNANTTALALMASLSAMMQQQQQPNKNTTTKEDISMNVLNPLSQLTSNPLINLESTLANVMANNFSRGNNNNTSAQSNNVDDDDDEDEKSERNTTTPIDFSLKPTSHKAEKKTKSKKKMNGENGTGREEETPLDLSAPKRPEDFDSNQSNKDASFALLSQMANLSEGANANNNNNFAAMAAAAAAAAAFSPNFLTKMAATMSPWGNFNAGGNNNKTNNTNESNATAAAFAALFQQVYGNSTNNGQSNQSNSHQTNKSINKSMQQQQQQSQQQQPPSVSALFQSFPDLYWNNKFQNKTSNTSAPSFGGLSNSAALLSARHHNHQPPPAASQPMRTKSSSGRQNPWQAQWINRSSEQTRDVFTCVWCKDSFKSLAEMTDHMKRSPRCGMAGMQQHHSHAHHQQPQQPGQQHRSSHSPASGGGNGHHPLSSSASASSSQHSGQGGHKQLANLGGNVQSPMSSIKEAVSHGANSFLGSSKSSGGAVNMPRKLVRGQDVWLGRGAEQTRQILKCKFCFEDCDLYKKKESKLECKSIRVTR